MTDAHGYVPLVTREHIEASSEALSQLCEAVSVPPKRRGQSVINVQLGHYDHGAFLTLQLDGFAILDVDPDGRLQPVTAGPPVIYAVVVNRPVDNQISQTLRFLSSLLERQNITDSLKRGDSGIAELDKRVAEVDDQVAAALTEQLRTEHWRDVARAIGERAKAAGHSLIVEFSNPLLSGSAIRRRTPVLRHVYNSMEPVRAAIDRVASGMARAARIEGDNISLDQLAQGRDILDIGQLRHYLAHLVRDAFVCGNGYLALGANLPSLRLMAPETIEILGPESFGIIVERERSIQTVGEKVLHDRGAHQVASPYGVSLLEPFVVLLSQLEVVDRAIEEAERFPVSDARDRWLAQNREMRQRISLEQVRRVELLLGSATTGMPPAAAEVYFPGTEIMTPAVPSLEYSDPTD